MASTENQKKNALRPLFKFNNTFLTDTAEQDTVYRLSLIHISTFLKAVHSGLIVCVPKR